MGATGSGKTTVNEMIILHICLKSQSILQFINVASGSDLRVGRGLVSCTVEVAHAQPFWLDGLSVTLIDTPGFDDTTTSDTDILTRIAAFLSTS